MIRYRTDQILEVTALRKTAPQGDFCITNTESEGEFSSVCSCPFEDVLTMISTNKTLVIILVDNFKKLN